MKSLQDFIEDLGDDEAARIFSVKKRTVASWRRGERSPRNRDIPSLIEASAGELNLQSFFVDKKSNAA